LQEAAAAFVHRRPACTMMALIALEALVAAAEEVGAAAAPLAFKRQLLRTGYPAAAAAHLPAELRDVAQAAEALVAGLPAQPAEELAAAVNAALDVATLLAPAALLRYVQTQRQQQMATVVEHLHSVATAAAAAVAAGSDAPVHSRALRHAQRACEEVVREYHGM
jgi:ADP-ribosylglycohydrolase